ncbi:MAG: hypothetical protein U0694_26205, partial [Anaerolineae bacterium]
TAGGAGFVTFVRRSNDWLPASTVLNRPLAYLPAAADKDGLSGAGDGFRWQARLSPQAGGFRWDITLEAERRVELNPAMVLWLGELDNMNDRQAHTWRQTVLRAPTVNQQGLGGNDLPACYLYDHATHTETICYFPPDSFAWAPQRFYEFTMREVLQYRPQPCYGVGLVSATPQVTFPFEAGTHHLAWWFTQRYRDDIPSTWEAQSALLDAVLPLLDTVPTVTHHAIGWQAMAENALEDLAHPACWVEVEHVEGLRAYVGGSSALKRDEPQSFELMTQMDVLFPLLLWKRELPKDDRRSNDAADAIINRLLKTLPHFARPDHDFIANNYPPRAGDSFMDTWYFLENALIKLPWVAYLTHDLTLKVMFLSAVEGAMQLARNTHYLFPLFADAQDWQPRGSLLNVGVGGLYAAGCVLAYQLGGQKPCYLHEAANALNVMLQLPPHQLTHEPQQLSYAAAAAHYLARAGCGEHWDTIAAHFVDLTLRMGYWGKDSAVPFYDPRGMFQACASLCYPAYKENVESLITWPELLRDGVGHTDAMAAFANLQREHNYAFFDPYLPQELQRGPCHYIPYEDLATAEFTHTAKLGKELYGAGEVFWSALLFGKQVEPREVLCLWLDVPSLELKSIPPVAERHYLLYNPTAHEQQVNWNDAAITLPPHAMQVVTG